MEDAHNMIKVKFLVKRDIINYYTNKQNVTDVYDVDPMFWYSLLAKFKL